MTLKLPLLNDWKGTFARWAAELRQNDKDVSSAIAATGETIIPWTNFKPVFSGSLTFTVTGTVICEYKETFDEIHLNVWLTGTWGGISGGTTVMAIPSLTLPTRRSIISGWADNGGNDYCAVVWDGSSGMLNIYKRNAGAWTLVAGELRFTGYLRK